MSMSSRTPKARFAHLSPFGPTNRPQTRTPSGAINTLTPTQISRLKESFQLLDKDSDGIISTSDLTSMLSSLGLDTSPSALATYLPPGTSTFNLASFLTVLSTHLSQLAPEQELLTAFEAFDEDDDGVVDVGELKTALGGVGERMSEREVEEVMRGFTRRGGLRKGERRGEVFSYRQFVEVLAGKGQEEEEEEGK